MTGLAVLTPTGRVLHRAPGVLAEVLEDAARARMGTVEDYSGDARDLLREARRYRKGSLRGYGNAIVPQVAAEFVAAYMEATVGMPQ